MDPFHERLARVALRAAGQYGFALAGGYAIQAHGFLDRLSADVDLFAPSSVEADFATAVDAVIQEFGRDGLAVVVEIRNTSFARLSVASDSDRSKVEMGVDWRKHSPVQLAIGPVLDAVANKVCALFGRAEVRDYIDVDASWGAVGTPETSCVAPELASALKNRMSQWAHEIRSANGTDGDPIR